MVKTEQRVGEVRYSVDYDFRDGKPYTIKTNFETAEEAQEWADKNTTDGKVFSYKRIW